MEVTKWLKPSVYCNLARMFSIDRKPSMAFWVFFFSKRVATIHASANSTYAHCVMAWPISE